MGGTVSRKDGAPKQDKSSREHLGGVLPESQSSYPVAHVRIADAQHLDGAVPKVAEHDHD